MKIVNVEYNWAQEGLQSHERETKNEAQKTEIVSIYANICLIALGFVVTACLTIWAICLIFSIQSSIPQGIAVLIIALWVVFCLYCTYEYYSYYKAK